MKNESKGGTFGWFTKVNLLKSVIVISFLLGVGTLSYKYTGQVPNNGFLVLAALFGAYMALNIGANDVANNVGPAVGSKAMTLTGAIIIAAVFEASGAFIAGGDVVGTIKSGIINIEGFGDDPETFIWLMTAALFAAGLWLNIATKCNAPVSTTHSIVGGVMGAGIAAGGFSIVDWETVGEIIASWFISPVLGGFIAAGFLYAIKRTIVFQDDKVAAAKARVPVFIAIMTGAFTIYLTMKGLKKIWPQIVDVLVFLPDAEKPSFAIAASFGIVLALVVYCFVKSIFLKKQDIENNKRGINALFTIPLIFAAALLSFAHGANDVANAIGPLAAINDAILNGGISTKASIPFWVMAVGAIGIVIGLALFGPKLIKTVGSEITELDQMRAFCVAMAASITVILASQLGLPVSSTHIAVGGIFGVGFLREYLQYHVKIIDFEKEEIERDERVLAEIKAELQALKDIPREDKTEEDYLEIIRLLKLIPKEEVQISKDLKSLKKLKKKYVKRNAFNRIISAWLITVPATAVLAAALFFMIRGIMI